MSSTRYLHTSDLARAVGIHPNTVRRYVDRGLLPPVEYSPAGYRRFTRRHLDCLRLVCQVYCIQYPGKALHLSGKRVVQAALDGDLRGALQLAYSHLELVRAERAHADAAASLLERWASSEPVAIPPLQIGQAARLLGLTIDTLRNWDRNGLLDVPRDPSNGYRRYRAQEISRLRIIRMLSRAGYSFSAILRMLVQLDQGDKTNLRRALDTPGPDEDAYLASDRWLSTLVDQERRAHTLIALLEEIIHKQSPENG